MINIPNNVDLIISRHGQTKLNELIESNFGYSRMEWEDNSSYKLLTNRGKQQSEMLGLFLKRKKWLPDIFLTSTSERSIKTTEIVSSIIGFTLSSNNFFSMEIFKETCCYEFIDDHIPNHTFSEMASYEDKILESHNVISYLGRDEFVGKKILFIGHELRNTFLLDAILSRKTEMNVSSVFFPNCGVHFLSRGNCGKLIDEGGAFSVEELLG